VLALTLRLSNTLSATGISLKVALGRQKYRKMEMLTPKTLTSITKLR